MVPGRYVDLLYALVSKLSEAELKIIDQTRDEGQTDDLETMALLAHESEVHFQSQS